ncbi:methyl-CpG-binding domain protein 2-like [Cervus canadensis]|uniref:methyl-CpG-binding domain protein 2-like n=1 Tax=Cervus canadensis TaxID=1574408 RepID=UPI001C9E6656|nr:methyl-CpG-binding domain protein 2-like [Cervus canadensis]
MRGGWGGNARSGGGGPVARAPAPLEWRRGPRRQPAWGAARGRVYECVRPGSRGSRAAGRAGEAPVCLPVAPAPRRPPRRARALAPHGPAHTRRPHAHPARGVSEEWAGAGAGGGPLGKGRRRGRWRDGEARREGRARGRGRAGEAGRPTSPGGGGGARPSPATPAGELVGRSF